MSGVSSASSDSGTPSPSESSATELSLVSDAKIRNSDSSTNGSIVSTETEDPDIEPQDSGRESFEMSSTVHLDATSEDSEDEYGGRGEPEAVRGIQYATGDVLEFSQEGVIYSGEVEDIDADYIYVKHSDQKYVGQLFGYHKVQLSKPPNWIALQDSLRSKSITRFSDVYRFQTIVFGSIDLDPDGSQKVRKGIILDICREYRDLKILRLVGDPKQRDDDEFDDKQNNEFYQDLSNNVEIWN